MVSQCMCLSYKLHVYLLFPIEIFLEALEIIIFLAVISYNKYFELTNLPLTKREVVLSFMRAMGHHISKGSNGHGHMKTSNCELD